MKRASALPSSWHRGAVALAALGAAGLLLGGLLDWKRACGAFLADFTLFAGIAQAGVVLVAILTVTQAGWAGPLRAVSLSFGGFVPVGVALFLVWPLVGSEFYDAVAQGRLAAGALFLRDGVILLVLCALSWWFARISGAAASGVLQHSKGARVLAPILLIAYAYGWSWLAFDLLMALAPEFVSTLFGLFVVVGNVYGALASAALFALLLARTSRGAALVTRERLHDLGKLLFAFCLLWTYLLFSQILPIWYGNLPREIRYLALRMSAPWTAYAWATVVLAFVVPFAALLGRAAKQSPQVLAPVSLSVLLGLWLERSLMVAPAISQAPPLGWIELVTALGFAGGFVWSAGLALRASRPGHDPALG